MTKRAVNIRVTDEELAEIDRRALGRRMTRTQFLIASALGSPPIEGTHAGVDPAPPSSVAGAKAVRREQTAQALRRTEVEPHWKAKDR